MRNPKLWIAVFGFVAAPFSAVAPAAAAGLPLTPATDSATTVDQPQPCINYLGNIPCNLSTLSASLGLPR
ncbi:hypothetical protein DFR70_101349 [Nocardia tenerifensis]|uniref:Small secreted domain DUF320 n=1 Tax=Nocardia tenerifensis TaxID=228006 RepID=A0A318K9D5_9NOCA|nr:hypothetical protein DFR70_101349 [Nocardia tenerifensis]